MVASNTLRLERFEQVSEQLEAKVDFRKAADAYETCLGNTTDWFPDTQDALTILKHNFTLGVITNGFSRVQRIKYQRLALHSFFKCYVVSEDVGYFKPQKEIFDLALNKIDCQSHEVLMVGDSLTSDYQGALNKGMDFCWVNPRNQALPAYWPRPKYAVKAVTELITILKVVKP